MKANYAVRSLDRTMTVSYKIVATLWLFRIIQIAPSPLKKLLRPSVIEKVEVPIVDNYIYVDKTDHIWELCNPEEGCPTGSCYVFLRPRRFGKTTFLRSMQRILSGTGRHIFNGTKIHSLDYSWESHPVMFMDLADHVIEDRKTCSELMENPRNTATRLEKRLDTILIKFKQLHNLSKPKNSDLAAEFSSILEEMNENGKFTVVLIDEYDFGLLNNFETCPVAETTNRELMKQILLVLKTYSGCIRFAFVTGISKAVYATLGTAIDMIDLSRATEFHNIAGFTDSDLKEHYSDHIAAVSNRTGKPIQNITEEMKRWFNGYKFTKYAPNNLYNPGSIHKFFTEKAEKDYWSDSTQSTLLYKQMVQRPYDFMGLDLKRGVRSRLIGSSTSLNRTDPVLLIFDAGYLSIEGMEDGFYTLKFPNEETEIAFYQDMAHAAREAENGTSYEIRKIGLSLSSTLPAVTTFMEALDVAMMKVGRLSFEEWYDYHTMKFIIDAGNNLHAKRQTTKYTKEFGKKIIDVTGNSENTKFLFEIKFNRGNNYDAWSAVNESIKATLDDIRQDKNSPFKFVLAAGITYTQNDENHAIHFYQAKLFARNGKVIGKYQSENLQRYYQSMEQFFARKKQTPLFMRDDLFLINETLDSEETNDMIEMCISFEETHQKFQSNSQLRRNVRLCT